MIPLPEQYATTGVSELLEAAARGYILFDQRLIRALVSRPEQTIEAALRFAEDDESYGVGISLDLVNLFACLPTPRALPFLIDQIRVDPSDLPDPLIDAVVRIKAEAFEPLLELHDALGERAGELTFLLTLLGIRDERIGKLIDEVRLSDTEEAEFLTGIYRGSLEPASEEEPFDIMAEYPEVLEPEWSALPESVKAPLLRDADPRRRLLAARGFIDAEFSPAVAAKLLAVAREDPDVAVRAACWEALTTEVEDAKVQNAMLDCLRQAQTPLAERAAVAVALAPRLGDEPEVREAIATVYAAEETRAQALEAMWLTLDGVFGEYMARHVEDPDLDIRRQAIIGVGYLSVRAEASRLEALFRDDDWREDALFAYALAAPGDTSGLGVRRLLEQIEGLAAGLNEEEEELVRTALDTRLRLHGRAPVFFPDETDEESAPATSQKVGRNDPCPCGSGKKYKKCCGG